MLVAHHGLRNTRVMQETCGSLEPLGGAENLAFQLTSEATVGEHGSGAQKARQRKRFNCVTRGHRSENCVVIILLQETEAAQKHQDMQVVISQT